MMGFTLRARHPALWAVLLSLAGCAVQTTPTGQVHVGLDNAELLGQTLASFKLADGSEGRLRVLGGQYSVKLQRQFKVVDIPNATMVRVLSASNVGGRTLVVLEKSERNCDTKTQLLSIQGAEVLMWDFGDCHARPMASVQPDQATFDFVQPQRTTRFTYRDAKLMRGEFPNLPPPLPGAPPVAALPMAPGNPRYVPGPPVVANLAKAPAKAALVTTAAAPAPAASPAPAPTRTNAPAPRPAPPAPARALDFPTQEQKPVRIVLDK